MSCLRSAQQGFTPLSRSAQQGFRPLSRSAQQGFTPLSRAAQQGFTPLSRFAQQGFTPSSRSAQQGFTPSSRSAQQGFTLIELLVALMIFALLAGAGVVLLRGSVDTQRVVRANLDALADVQRGIATLDSDLSQAVARIGRTEAGTYAPAFFGRRPQSGEPLMEFVRGGWSNPSGQRHPALQRVEYWWREGRLERVTREALDGARSTTPSTLFEQVTALSLRYRDAEGAWREEWQPRRPQEMPLAVEMVLTRRSDAPLTLRFLLGPEPAPEAPEQLLESEGNGSAPASY